MDYTNYGNDRWRIAYDAYAGVRKTAVNRLYGAMQACVPYVLTTRDASEPAGEYHTVYVGTADCAALRRYADAGAFTPETHKEGYSIFVGDDPLRPGKKIALLQGADEAGVLYAVQDFLRYYVYDLCRYHGYHYNKRYRPFMDDALPFSRRSFPRIEHRGLWSWGHVIYDYRGYIDRMAENKLNTLILWNDFAPLNAADVIDYAHSRAVKVIWGYSWCWGEPVDPTDEAQFEKWAAYVLDTYEKQYLPLRVDGLYFQAFTETRDTTICGRSIAETVVEWVRRISERVYARYPDLWLQFGLHTTSVREETSAFSRVDPRMSVVWEDAGSFPYAYDPAHAEDARETLAFTKRLVSLRGESERFGAVFKGFTVLNWDIFEHQKGVPVIGESEEAYLARRTLDKEFTWRYAAPYWINGAPFLAEILQAVADAPARDRLVTALAEDGCLERENHVGLSLLAALLWDPHEDTKRLLETIYHNDARA